MCTEGRGVSFFFFFLLEPTLMLPRLGTQQVFNLGFMVSWTALLRHSDAAVIPGLEWQEVGDVHGDLWKL